MSNILIIKHGSLGDLIQANGAIKDIKENFSNDKVFLLTTPPYAEFMSSCPYIDGVLIDKRLPRWNLFYLRNLRRTLDRFLFKKVLICKIHQELNFIKISYSKGIFFGQTKKVSSNETINEEKDLSCFRQNRKSINQSRYKKYEFYKKNDLSWAVKNVKNIINRSFEGNYILIFPFCSPKLIKKKWPYYHILIELLKKITVLNIT